MRKEKMVSRETLAYGITSISQMRRIEQGNIEVDVFLLQALIQRLGVEPDMFDYIVTRDEYEIISLRHECTMGLLEGKDIEKSLNKLQKKFSSKSPLQKQMYAMISACERYSKDGRKTDFQARLLKAMECTGIWPHDPELAQRRFSRQELNILLLYVYVSGDTVIDLEKLLSNIKKYCVSITERNRIIPKCSYVIACSLYQKGEVYDALKHIEDGIDILRRSSVFALLLPALRLKRELLEVGDMKKDIPWVSRNIELLERVYQISGQEEYVEWEFLKEFDHAGYIVNSELLKMERVQNGLTQMELAEGICETETVSRIESGKRKRNTKDYYKLLEKMGVCEEEYSCIIITERYHLYELARELLRSIFRGESEKANELLRQVEWEIDSSYVQNEVFLQICKMSLKQLHWNSVEEKRDYVYQLLNKTMRTVDGKPTRVPRWGEANLLLRAVNIESTNNNIPRAIEIEKDMLMLFQKQKMDYFNKAEIIARLYISLVYQLGELGNLKEAKKYAVEGIKYMVQTDIGAGLPQIISNEAKIEYEGNNLNVTRRLLQDAFYLFDLFKLEKYKLQTIENYKMVFHEDIG